LFRLAFDDAVAVDAEVSGTSAEGISASVSGTIMWTVPLRVTVRSFMVSDSPAGAFAKREDCSYGLQ
jgi:hypothetical protein